MNPSNVIEFMTKDKQKTLNALRDFLNERARNPYQPSEEDRWNSQYKVHDNANDDQGTMMDALRYLDYTPEQIADMFKSPYKTDPATRSRTLDEIKNTPHNPTPESFQRIYDSLIKARAENKI